ncbi:MAG: DNA alkylation response protein, partial [Acidimicrobiales bacterium]
LPRLYREAPLNAIWEGAGNVIALDVLRALARAPEVGQAFLAEVERGLGADHRLDDEIARVGEALQGVAGDEMGARRLIERLALCWSGSLLVQHGDPAVADAYIRSRIGGDHGSEYGTLSPGADIAAIAVRAVPQPD